MNVKAILPAILGLALLSCCKSRLSRLDLLPVDPDFDLHVQAVISNFESVHNDFMELLHDYNNHLSGNEHGDPETMEAYVAYYDKEHLPSAYIDTTLSAAERLDILDEKIDALVENAWMFERSYSLHYNAFHGVWNCEWAKFYSSVPEGLAPATYVRCVEENLNGVAGFISSLRLDFDDHMEKFHPYP
jgi:hypothetical protein